MDKQSLYQNLEALGFDCRRNPRYTVQMLTQIKNDIEMREHEVNEQLVELMKEQSLRKKLENKIIGQDIKLEKFDKEFETLFESLEKKENACLLYKRSLKDRDNALNELKVCHDKAHKNYDEAKLRIEQLEFELKELRNEYRTLRKKNKKKNKLPPPPAYDSLD